MATEKKFAAPIKTEAEIEALLKQSFFGSLAQHNLLLGAHTGLLDVLHTFDKPATSQEIADAGGCKERYVREWLYGMVVAGLLSVEEEEERFFLPPTHRKIVASYNPWVILACMRSLQPFITENVSSCFKKDGPLGTEQMDVNYDLPDFYLTRLQERLHTWEAFESQIIDKIPGFKEKLENGAAVIEVGCNRAHTLRVMARKFPKSYFYGNDIYKPEVDFVNEEIKSEKLTNIKIEEGDLYNMSDEHNGKYDVAFIICTIHDLPFVSKCVASMKKVIKPDGYISIIDLGTPGRLQTNLDNPKYATLLGLGMWYCLPLGMSYEGSEGIGTAWLLSRAKNLIEKGGVDIVMTEPVFEIEIFRHYLCKPKKEE